MASVVEIFKFLLKIDLRSKKPNKTNYGRIILIFITNFLWFSLLSLTIALSLIPENRENIFSEYENALFLLNFSFVLFSVEILLLIFTVLVEFETFVLNQAEIEFLSSLPVDPVSYGLAKYMNFLFFVFLLSFSINLPPTLVLLIFNLLGILQLKGFIVSFSYFVVATLVVIVTSNFVLLFMLFIGRGLKFSKLRKILLPAQIIAVFITFFVYQIINRLFSSADPSESLFALIDKIFKSVPIFVPQIVASKLFIFLAGLKMFALNLFDIFSIAIALCILLIPIFTLRIEMLKNIIDSSRTSDRGKKYIAFEIVKFLKKFLFKKEIEFAMYELVYIHLRRDRSVMVKILSAFAIGIAIAIYFLLFDEVKNPLIEPSSKANVLMLISIFFNVTAGIIAITNHRSYEARWIYHFITADEMFYAMNGAFKVLWHHILIPLLALFSILYFILLKSFQIVLLHILTTAFLTKIFFNIVALISSHLPFSQPIEKLSSIEKILIQFSSFFAVLVAVLFERGFYFMILKFKNLIFTGAILLLLIIVERYTFHIFRQKILKVAKWRTEEEL
ncbi:hypothetical protein [Candidatus Chrysopegis kryptomonas]|uniref:ABC-2 type transport system permease protein n=1 Tax=Candidatus Chryseopegocella kryptomonas TaxID=1633643 RepID=A0A0P1MZ08_9BACT|nr:hypothetical protein [Candidatus Chrysopegis kryptomonas]CUT00984.1 hypothetical protein JGI23_00960 [Candidatus Chrysopegis kryptomonas]